MNKSVNIVASMPYAGEYQDGDFIGVDRGSGYLFEKGIEMVLAVGDFDSIDPQLLEKIKAANTPIKALNPVKDDTDLDSAIHAAKELGYQNIYVYGALGGRVDHTIVNINLLKKNKELILYDDTSIVYVLKAGVHSLNDLSQEYKYCSFLCIEECLISLINYKFPLDNYLLKNDDTLCISNERKTNSKVICEKDIILVASR